jgi:hypothetical protein
MFSREEFGAHPVTIRDSVYDLAMLVRANQEKLPQIA